MKELTARQHGLGKWLALPLLVLGFLLVPLVLLPAHALPGHAAMMSMSNSVSSHHGEASGHTHDHDTHVPAVSDAATSHDGDHGHQAPYCDAGPDYSAVAPTRQLNTPTELGFLLLALAFAATAVAALFAEPAWARRLRHWFSRPPWQPSGTAFLHFACIART